MSDGETAGTTAVPEPDVKAALRNLGVTVPKGVSGPNVPDASTLRPPLALKAYGPGIVHKTELGAVRLGLEHDELGVAIDDIRARLRRHGITPAGFFVEEQHAADDGVELIAGVVRREPFGLVAALGLGGTVTELLDLVALRVLPLEEADARALVREFPGAGALGEFRGRAAMAADAVVQVLMALAGPDGLAMRLGDELVALECNPVLVTPAGAVALDARLTLRERARRARPAAPDRLHPTVRTAGDRGRGCVGDAERFRQPRPRRVPRLRLDRRSLRVASRRHRDRRRARRFTTSPRSTRRSTICWSRCPQRVAPTSCAPQRGGCRSCT